MRQAAPAVWRLKTIRGHTAWCPIICIFTLARRKALYVGSKHMTTSNEFGKYYKTISNAELLSTLENPSDYQMAAIEAARNEFLARQLSDEELKEAREILNANQSKKEKQKQKIKNIEDGIRTTGLNFIETLNPIQSEAPSTEKTIKLIVIVFSGLFLYRFLKDFNMHISFVKDLPRFPFTSMLYLLPLIVLPIALFTFWKKMSIGWTLFTICATFSAIAILWLLIQSFLWQPSGIAAVDNIFGSSPILTLIIQLLFYLGTFYLVCKRDIRNVFLIGENKMIATIVITAVFSFFAVYVTT